MRVGVPPRGRIEQQARDKGDWARVACRRGTELVYACSDGVGGGSPLPVTLIPESWAGALKPPSALRSSDARESQLLEAVRPKGSASPLPPPPGSPAAKEMETQLHRARGKQRASATSQAGVT